MSLVHKAKPLSNLGTKLLWENPNPTSSFGSQTVEIDLSNYESVLIECILSSVIQTKLTGYCEKEYESGNIGGSNGTVAYGRGFTMSDSGITFGSAVYNRDVNDKTIIPQKIYGAKFTI